MATILVVEDDLAIRSDIVDLLDLEGYHTIGAEHGQEGLTQARQHFPDLILSDVMMPEVDG
jgi:CheY-like chemotaxis protein